MYVYLHMYVCVIMYYVCVYVCLYTCMHVCINVCISLCMYVCMLNSIYTVEQYFIFVAEGTSSGISRCCFAGDILHPTD